MNEFYYDLNIYSHYAASGEQNMTNRGPKPEIKRSLGPQIFLKRLLFDRKISESVCNHEVNTERSYIRAGHHVVVQDRCISNGIRDINAAL